MRPLRMLTRPFLTLPTECYRGNFVGPLERVPAHYEAKGVEAVPLCDVDTLLFSGLFQLGSPHHASPGDSLWSLPVLNMAVDRPVPNGGFS